MSLQSFVSRHAFRAAWLSSSALFLFASVAASTYAGGRGFVFFDGPDELLSRYEEVTEGEQWMGVLMENFDRGPLQFKDRDRPKTLVCHDFRGGYLPYESLSGEKVPIPTGFDAKYCADGTRSPPPDVTPEPPVETQREKHRRNRHHSTHADRHMPLRFRDEGGGEHEHEGGGGEGRSYEREHFRQRRRSSDERDERRRQRDDAGGAASRHENAQSADETAPKPAPPQPKPVHSSIVQPYVFTHWWNIDIFNYFSHKYITVPPKVWIDQGHRHGVLVLGTFITEGDVGYDRCRRLFGNQTELERTIESLIDLAIRYNFDGWLINIENDIDRENIPAVRYFLDSLRNRLRAHFPFHRQPQIIWYESVLVNGEWSNENELNEHNGDWFNHVDGFFLNYFWQPRNLTTTIQHLRKYMPHRSPAEVYVGVDVWGRNATGKWQTPDALSSIRRLGLSAALFAPGWLTEAFPNRDCAVEHSAYFWALNRPYVRQRPLTARRFSTDFHAGVSRPLAAAASGKRPPPTTADGNGDPPPPSAPRIEQFRLENGRLQPHWLSMPQTTIPDGQSGLALTGGGPQKQQTLFVCDIPVNSTEDSRIVVRLSSNRRVGLHLTFLGDVEKTRTFDGHLEDPSEVFVEQLSKNSLGIATLFQLEIPREAVKVTKIAVFEPPVTHEFASAVGRENGGGADEDPSDLGSVRIHGLDFWIE